MNELTPEQTQKLFDSMQCNDCKYQYPLSIHICSRDKHLVSELANNNVFNICTLFANEGIMEIGNFSGLGCEGFIKQTDEFKEIKQKAKQKVYNKIFTP